MSTKPDKLTIICGGEEVQVASTNGARLTVKVCVLPARLASRFLDLACSRQFQQAVELCCGAEENGYDCLPPATVLELFEKAVALNFPTCEALAEIHEKTLEKALPTLRKGMATAMKKLQQEMKEAVDEQMKSLITPLLSEISKLKSAIESQRSASNAPNASGETPATGMSTSPSP